MKFLLTSLLAGTAMAKYSLLQARQGGDAFVPGTSGIEYNCAFECGEDCVHPENGESCCTENYGCPSDSFCLTKGYCCPTGDDPATCALANGVTLPAGFQAGQTIGPGQSASSTSPASSKAPATSSAKSGPVTPVVKPSYSLPVGNASIPTATTFTPGKPTTSAAPFTGGVGRNAVGAEGGLLAFVAGFVGLLL